MTETIASLAILAIVVALLWPVRAGDGPSRKDLCLSNLKQIGVASQIYLADNDERMPLANWMDAMMPYLKNELMLTCPVLTRERQNYGYAMNLEVMGLDVASMKKPAEVIAFFETDALGRSVVANLAARDVNRHQGSSIVAYLDTHVRVFREGAPLRRPTLQDP